jgi:flagellar basal-body rod modification protein FlgD
MSVSPVGSSSANTNAKAQSGASMAATFDQFLTLLTTQLQNQNPLDPLDTNQFTQQLVQFAGVEQQLKTNSQLEALILQAKTQSVPAAAGFVGMKLTADGSTATLANNQANWSLKSPATGTATFTVTDRNNKTVYSETRKIAAGQQSFTWNGKDQNKVTFPAGDYRLSVAAKDSAGRAIAVSTEIEGLVDAVRFEGDMPILMMGNQQVAYDKVRQIRQN